MPRVVTSRPAVFAWLLLLPPWASGHHATAPAYDRSQIAEVEGEITEVFWRNPHIRFTMRGVDAGGRERTWDIETNSVSIVGRLGLSEAAVQVGARVRVAGNVGKLSDNALWLTNMLLPDGREILFGARYEPRWSQTTIGAPVRAEVTGDPTGALGVFRVWTSVGGGALPADWGIRWGVGTATPSSWRRPGSIIRTLTRRASLRVPRCARQSASL